MSDLVDKLREAITLYSACLENSDKHMTLLSNSAAEIERLSAENAQLNATLQLHDAGYGITDREIAQQLSKQIVTLKAELAMRKDICVKYEELRSIIDGGSESMTHEDAVEALKAQPAQEIEWDHPDHRCGGKGCDLTCCQPAQSEPDKKGE